MAITKVTNSVVGSGSATDGYVLTADGSGNSAWEAAAGGASSINDLTDAKTFGTGSIMLGDTTTGTLSNANYNVGVGVDMLNSLTSGYANIAIGFESCKDLTTGHNNVAVGHATLYENIGGEQNVAIGANALQNNTSGNYNTAVGKSALKVNSTGADNVAVGKNALDALTTGYQNVAIGVNAATASTGTVYSNTVVGANAATAMTSGLQNTSIGAGASQLGTSASQTTSVGAGANLRLSTGDENTSVGYLAGQNITSGPRNVTIGSVAGQSISTGGYNVCIGWNAGNDITTGSRNICIGQNPETGYAIAYDRILMGYDIVGGQNDSFLIGRGTIDSQIAFGATSITAPSDIRLKEDIKDEEVGLEFIKDLRPVTFLWKKEKDIPKDMRAYKEGSEERTMNGKYNHGFIAQEVKEVIDKHHLKEGFEMWSEDDSDGRQRVAPAALISVMVKAIQELSAQVEELKSQIGV